jgi:hypothetical protein
MEPHVEPRVPQESPPEATRLVPFDKARLLALSQEIAEEVERCLLEAEPTRALHARMKARVAEGASRQDLLSCLEVKLDLLREEDREADEDHLLDVMDALYGWCSPQWRI